MSTAGQMAQKWWTGTLPSTGVITAGPLKGWRYAFLQFICIDYQLYVDMRCTRPNWPFPTDVRFQFNKHEIRVRSVSGQRAKRLDANALIARCLADGIAKTPTEDM